tara:strand:+ start:114 stop:614 length:501 start_codon:yes stop_codon:yes gene_type:complete
MKNKIVSIILINFLLISCGIYSFTGASIPNDAKNVVVKYFTTKVTNSPSSLNQIITEELKNKLLSQTNLYLEETSGDLIFIGEITKYQVTPIALQANESVAKNRLTISIKVKYENSLNNQQNFESNFSHYRDFNSSENLADIENILIEEISKELVEDVFNKAFVNW